MIGGVSWATGNVLVVPIVELVGLGLGFLFWSGGNLVFGYLIGRYGMFGVPKEAIAIDWLSWFGLVLGVAALGLFGSIDATLNDEGDESDVVNENDELLESARGERKKAEKLGGPFAPLMELQGGVRKAVGLAMAFGIGILYSVCMVPLTLWQARMADEGREAPSMDYLLPYFTGIFATSTIWWMLYASTQKPQVFPESILPSMISGMMWGVASIGMILATENLGFTTGYVIVCLSPQVVSSIWSVGVFREIRGARNLTRLGGAMALLVGAVSCFVVSKEQ